jgi:hypothetical protein
MGKLIFREETKAGIAIITDNERQAAKKMMYVYLPGLYRFGLYCGLFLTGT